MTHFSLLVRCPARLAKDELPAYLEEVLRPYCEQYDRDAADAHLYEPHFKFEDETESITREYETETTEMVRLEDGTLAWPWDDRFRKPGSIGLGSDTHEVPSHLKREQVPYKEVYASLAEFASEYHGYREGPNGAGRYGTYANPQAQWDWWVVGGRWAGALLRLRPAPATQAALGGSYEEAVAPASLEPRPRVRHAQDPAFGVAHADAARLRDLDWDWCAEETRRRVAEFWADLEHLRAGTKLFDHGDGPRPALMRLGWLTVTQPGEVPPADAYYKRAWERQSPPRFDVVRDRPDPSDPATQRALERLLSPIRPYAYLSEADGWQAMGESWGSETAESSREFADSFLERLRAGDDGDWLVTVDCHT
jgi:hypothetical protein